MNEAIILALVTLTILAIPAICFVWLTIDAIKKWQIRNAIFRQIKEQE